MAFQLRYFEVTVPLKIMNLCQIRQMMYCVAGSNIMPHPLGIYGTLSKVTFSLITGPLMSSVFFMFGMLNDTTQIYLCGIFERYNLRNADRIRKIVKFTPISASH